MSGRQRSAMAGLAVAIMVLGVVGASVRGDSVLQLVPFFSAGALFVIAGLVTAGRRPDNVSGRLLAAAGLAWLGAQTLSVIPNALAATVALTLLP